MATYYVELSDSMLRQMKKDPRINILDIKDGDFGLDQGTKKVEWEHDLTKDNEQILKDILKRISNIEEKLGVDG